MSLTEQEEWDAIERHFNRAEALRKQATRLRGPGNAQKRKHLRVLAEAHDTTAIRMREELTGEKE